MIKKVAKYEILVEEYSDKLQSKITERIADGWEVSDVRCTYCEKKLFDIWYATARKYADTE